MATPRKTEKAVFFVGVLAAGREELALACRSLADEFGPPHRCSLPLPFDNTGYYRDELGPSPIRVFLAFPGLFPTDGLAETKLASNRLEQELAQTIAGPWPRPVNLDPGYLTLAKLVLASAKNFAHRIHLSNGIYAEITLQYRSGIGFQPLPWTFPDYASGRYDDFFLDLRKELAHSLSK
jgi:hypothetical protein